MTCTSEVALIFLTGGPPVKSGGSKAAEFVLKCLVKIPTRICVSLANKVSLYLWLLPFLVQKWTATPENRSSGFPTRS